MTMHAGAGLTWTGWTGVLAGSVQTIQTMAEGAHTWPINWWAWSSHMPPMGWFLLDFGLFVGGLVWAGAKPLSRAFAQRHRNIKQAISEAASAHARARAHHQEQRAKLARLEADTQALLQSSQRDSEAERIRLLEGAKAYAAQLNQESKRFEQQEILRARMRLEHDMLDATLQRAEQILRHDLSPEDHAHLVDQAILDIETAGNAPQGVAPQGVA